MAYSRTGYESGTVDTGTPITVAIAQPSVPAYFISVVNDDSADLVVSLTMDPDPGDDGHPIEIRAGIVLTISPGAFTGFTISRVSGTAGLIDVYWW